MGFESLAALARQIKRPSIIAALVTVSVLLCCLAASAAASDDAAGPVKPFDGTPTQWHDGFARYDFVLDEQTLAITPFNAPQGERYAVGAPEKGKRRCVVVAPKTPAVGNPWSWQGCYWDHQPQTEVELLRRGFHIAYISADPALKPDKTWEAWYAFLTEHGLSKRPAFVGMSRGGEYAYTWATEHPEQVACIYADNPGTNKGVIAKLGLLADRDVPLLHVCGSIDPLLGRVSNVIESTYQQLGGRISVMIKDGDGHHPHSLRDATPIADWVEANWKQRDVKPPAFVVGDKVTRTSYYSNGSVYREFPKEGKWITRRGPAFSPCYDRYSFELPGVEGAVIVSVPATPAAGTPWVFRCGFGDRDASVDLALLAKGFHIVNTPMAYNADAPKRDQWTRAYEHLLSHGFSKTPALEGAGRAAGEMYAWAIENPQRVSCIYGENPVLRALGKKDSLVDSLEPLAKAGVPILHVCGSLDPAYETSTNSAAAEYEVMGGTMKRVVKEGEGHVLSLSDNNAAFAVNFILAAQK